MCWVLYVRVPFVGAFLLKFSGCRSRSNPERANNDNVQQLAHGSSILEINFCRAVLFDKGHTKILIDRSGGGRHSCHARPQQLACVYFEDEPSRRSAAKLPHTRRGAATNVAKLPELLSAKHSPKREPLCFWAILLPICAAARIPEEPNRPMRHIVSCRRTSFPKHIYLDGSARLLHLKRTCQILYRMK